MEYEIIYTDDYALIVSDEEIKKDNWFINTIQSELYCHNIEHYDVNKDYLKKIIAHRPLTDAPVLEGVPLLPKFSEEEDVAELSLKKYPFGNSERNAFITGYNKAKETYKYTEEDLRKAIELSWTPSDYEYPSLEEIIQSIQHPKRPKYFECEMEPKYKHIGAVKGIYGSGFRKKNLMYGLPKTITNSQGQKELVGSYIY